MIKYFISLFIFAIAIFLPKYIFADENLPKKLAGRILLQTESHGEAWYVNPSDLKRYYLGRPQDAFNLMRNMGIGITNANLDKIPIGFTASSDDSDHDGLSNDLEKTLGTDANSADTDNDGFNDKYELENHYNPSGIGRYIINQNFTAKSSGKIFLQVEKNGEAWYVSPADKMRYYLGRPSDAFAIMRQLSLGISNANLSAIMEGFFNATAPEPTCGDCVLKDPAAVFNSAAEAIRKGDKNTAVSYFAPSAKSVVLYTFDFLDKDGLFSLGNMMAGAKLTRLSEDEAIYTLYFNFSGWDTSHDFHIKKQSDGKWLMANL